MILVAIDIKAVVKGNLLIDLDISQGLQKDALSVLDGLTVRITRVIDQAGRIPLHIPVEIPLLGKIENVNGSRAILLVFLELLPRPLFALLFINSIAYVFDEVLLLLDWLHAINALSVNHGSTNFHEVTLSPLTKLFDAELFFVLRELAVLLFLFAHFKSETDLLEFLVLNSGKLVVLIVLRKKLKDLPQLKRIHPVSIHKRPFFLPLWRNRDLKIPLAKAAELRGIR